VGNLKSWPWIGLSGVQFWSAKEIKLFARNRAEQTLHISSVLISEGVTSINGRKRTQVAAQRPLIFAQALGRRFGLSQHADGGTVIKIKFLEQKRI
jgi:hypothetical protein